MLDSFSQILVCIAKYSCFYRKYVLSFESWFFTYYNLEKVLPLYTYMYYTHLYTFMYVYIYIYNNLMCLFILKCQKI